MVQEQLKWGVNSINGHGDADNGTQIASLGGNGP